MLKSEMIKQLEEFLPKYCNMNLSRLPEHYGSKLLTQKEFDILRKNKNPQAGHSSQVLLISEQDRLHLCAQTQYTQGRDDKWGYWVWWYQLSFIYKNKEKRKLKFTKWHPGVYQTLYRYAKNLGIKNELIHKLQIGVIENF